MLGPDMLTAHFEAFGHRRGEADRMAAQTLFYAMARFLRELIHRQDPWRRQLRKNARP
jgi:hypothetical protein